ncbi:DUF3159 domain-containing protein [Schaalia sp. lx-260]|uniref:DUF3159 domain-containing protein n=1 Tax=Schaalia sp. lx-260 TaxID=2899082 RepID=UPI001E5B4762|nr:DUF3159 domain-containing protein [Schaalia sp. lx-260]MCD4549479.1 DUF3159 domain-containing protein [Schaalia sp. lx-260]
MNTTPQRLAQRGKSGIFGQLGSDSFSWYEAVGGWRAMLESSLPAAVFIAIFSFTRHVKYALIAAAALAVVFCVIRLVQKQSMLKSLPGTVGGVAVGVFWASWTGRGEDFFAAGLVTAAFFAAILLLSMPMRRPFIGIFIGYMYSLPRTWWSDENYASLRRRVWVATWMWAAVFLVRFWVQFPLWFWGKVPELGIVKIILGFPLFAVAAWGTWLLLAPVIPHSDSEESSESESEGTVNSDMTCSRTS